MADADEGSMTIVCWSGDLDKVWPQYILATTGAGNYREVMNRRPWEGGGGGSREWSGTRLEPWLESAW